MFCKKCGKQIPDSTKFCPYCGEAVLCSNQPGPGSIGTPGSRIPGAQGQAPAGNMSGQTPDGRGGMSGQPGGPNRRPAPQPEKGGKNMKPFIIICGVIIAVAVIITGIFVFKTLTGGSPSDSKQIEEELDDKEKDEKEEKDGEEEGTEASETVEEGQESQEEEAEPTEAIPTEAATSPASAAQTEAPSPTVPATEPATAAADMTQYPTYFVANCEEFITLRAEPSTSAAALAQIPYGSPVSYIETSQNGFYKIIYNGKTGYGLASYLSTTQPAPKSNTSAARSYTTYYVVNCDEWISLRTSPSTSASRVTTIPYGAAVSFVETASNGFYKITYNGHTGYALASYLSTVQPSARSSSCSVARVVNCQSFISLRVSPNTQAAKYLEIPLGEYVTVISTGEANGFWKIWYDGYEGYALGQYLSLE